MLSRIVRARRTVRPPGLRAYATAPQPSPVAPLKVAVIGAGPSGFYAASRILQLLPDNAAVKVDMYERLPTPYGLVRYGVAPDHPEVKNCQHKFDELSADPRFEFFGNVAVDQPASSESAPAPSPHIPHYTYPHALHVPLDAVAPHYNAVVFSYGASRSNPLGSVPGSSASDAPLRGVYPALAFVGWYNGHPAFADLAPDLSKVETVDVVGQGNVALDVARILLSSVDSLRSSDLPESVLATLAASSVRRVRAVGRRGPAQVAFTTKELREMVKLPGVSFSGVDAGLMAQAKELAKGDRARTRMLALMDKPTDGGGNKYFDLAFLRSPHAFLPKTEGGDTVGAVEWDINELEFTPGQDGAKPTATARKTGQTETTPTDMVVESVGYRSEPLGWAPFDAKRGRLHNDAGRVTDPQGALVPGAYAAGWVARGPVGVIASTMADAYGLVDTILHDYADGRNDNWTARPSGALIPGVPEPGRPDAIERGLRDGSVVDIPRWLRIDAAERELGKRSNRAEREKFTRVEDMLNALG